MSDSTPKIPRSAEDDYSEESLAARRAFIEAQTGVTLNHTKQYSYDPHVMAGNIENIWGVAQIPIGVAGPLLVNAAELLRRPGSEKAVSVDVPLVLPARLCIARGDPIRGAEK